MDYVKLGRTGLEVSRLCLGCMTFGTPDRGPHTWTLDDEKSRPIIKRALELGVNFFDTANVYSDGTSEEIVGRALKELARRDEVVIATKVWARMRPGPNGQGLSRVAIMTEIDNSLRRLGVDHVDLYQIHRNDPNTPIEETMEALHDVVKAGKARYIGASNMAAWQFARALYVADRHGWTRFATMQDHLNLLYREEEREMLPLCRAEGIGVIPWSPDGARTVDPELGRNQRAAGDGRVRQDALYSNLRSRPAGGRARGRGCEGERRSPRAGRPGLGVAEAGGHRADHRGLEAAASRRRGREPVAQADSRGNRDARRAIHAPSPRGMSEDREPAARHFRARFERFQ